MSLETPDDPIISNATIGMQPRLLLLSAWKALTANKLRAVLSALGVMIGVFSVVTLISLAQMGAGAITNQVSALGVNMLIVTSESPRSGSPKHELVLSDARAISQRLHGFVAHAAPTVMGSFSIKMGQKANASTIIGVTPSYMSVCNVELRAGRFITEEDVNGSTQVAVVGPSVVAHLLGDRNRNPLGQRIEINRSSFRIVGVTQAKGSSLGGDSDDQIYLPLTTVMHRLENRTNLDMIAVEARSPDVMNAAENSLRAFFRQRHHIVKPYADNDDVNIGNLSQALKILGKIGGIVVMLVGGIGLISLLVGGIGIMNIMLVSVTERTREIGLRKSVGATKSDILFQFLLEAVFISLIGGLLGMALSVPVVGLAALLFHLSFHISAGVTAMAVLFSVGVGILFGSYPAAKAAAQNPIDCLRFE